ncbi:MAG: glycosyl hydrolase-related protein [Chloroflexota bacterium]|nr:glycosyl hydrolase-related protein [Chloroflexota bacterium]
MVGRAVGDVMGSRHERRGQTLYMIGQAHIDAVWLWQWPEALQEVRATFQSALERLREFDDFVFTCSSAAYYEAVERTAPQMFEEIRQRVAEGRWEIVGGWWVEPDCNLPGGESMVRQGLYGQRYFKEKFGVTARVGYNPDAFGHQATIPQIMAKSGMDSYVFLRPEPYEKGLPGRVFWWEADDGSRLLAYRIPHGYATSGGHLERVVRRVAQEVKEPIRELMCFYGVGNHGGGPTIENIRSIKRLDGEDGLPRLVLSGPGAFFDSIRDRGLRLPVVHDELQYHARGCYTSQSEVKRQNRRVEHLLLTAEAWSTVASQVTGASYPANLSAAWRNVCFNQFHDILAGSSIEPAYQDARDTYGESAAIAGRALDVAIQSLAWGINLTPPAGFKPGEASWMAPEQPVIVFNPHAWPTKMPVELEFGTLHDVRGVIDDEGRELPIQVTQSLATVSGGRRRLAFVAELPALGYRTYRVVTGEPEAAQPQPAAGAMHDVFAEQGETMEAEAEGLAATQRRDLVLENEWLRVTIDPATGTISSLYDCAAELEVLAGRAAQPVIVEDGTDTWGHGLVSLHSDAPTRFTPTSVRLLEQGRVRSVIRAESEHGGSKLRQDFILYAGLRRLDVNVTLDWREQHRALKLRFPVNLFLPRATYEIGYGHIERPTNGEEQPGHRWIDLTGLRHDRRSLYGLAILNDAKYGYDVLENSAGLTVVRSPIFAHHQPFVPVPDRPYAYMDQGLQTLRYSLIPHDGAWEMAELPQRAAELNQPPIALIESFHDGSLPLRASYASVDAANVVLNVLKQAEDGDDIVVRAYETTRNATTTTIRLPLVDRTFEATFGSAEIKTFRVPRDPTRPVVETNLLEWET